MLILVLWSFLFGCDHEYFPLQKGGTGWNMWIVLHQGKANSSGWCLHAGAGWLVTWGSRGDRGRQEWSVTLSDSIVIVWCRMGYSFHCNDLQNHERSEIKIYSGQWELYFTISQSHPIILWIVSAAPALGLERLTFAFTHGLTVKVSK